MREEVATRRLAKKVKIEAEKTSDVIDISYGRMGEPEVPACVMQNLSKLYIDKHLQLQRPPARQISLRTNQEIRTGLIRL